ncbi:hypothetical protein GCM10007890_22580 [Methylobacterium tardum]|uniref:Uncharacterized protein n=1 Tax=Methylobacterium tardum TaxID=374432 RepID=A0AA37TEG8_9HYPH|nr:hypothetical protein GCM10007890_22580 [Methylobacterium tardum]
MQLTSAEPGTGGKPPEEPGISDLAGPCTDNRGLASFIPAHSEDDSCALGDEIWGVEWLDHDDVAPAGVSAPCAHREDRRAT